MKLNTLKPILYSTHGNIQFAIVYDSDKHADIENGCSIDYAVEKHGEREVKHIEAYENQLVITI